MKPSIPKGTRDFSPTEMVKRNFIFKTIRNVFERYGYQPIETPAMENLETLMGKYGEEGDRLIFKILDSGDFFQPVIQKLGDDLMLASSGTIVSHISGKALRYDLTVPFARYVVQHQNEITFPFKRYQIQPVWRADRPQKGRYREFYQCDADVIGSNSLLNEVELVQMIDEVFNKLQVTSYKLQVNNRKILAGIAEVIGEKERIVDITVAIDKLDKIGTEEVNKEMKEKGVSENAIQQLQPLISFKGNNNEKISFLKDFLTKSDIGKKGIEEIEHIFYLTSHVSHLSAGAFVKADLTSHISLDITLARGLNYYTGAIFEVKANAGTLTSSICGGGRYDDLTGIFGLPNVSGVGISFGIDRIFDVMDELNLFEHIDYSFSTTKVMFVNFGEKEEKYCLPLLAQIRASGINAEIYPDHAKLKKQFDYANKKQISFVIVIGEDEMKSGELTLKNMNTGDQIKASIEHIITLIKM